MHTAIHPLIDTKTGEDIRIVFDVRDLEGDPVPLAGATVTYKVARRAGDAALLTKTEIDGIAVEGATATVSFNTAEIAHSGTPLLGDFIGQLRVTLGGTTLVAAEGPLSVGPVIL